MRSPRMRFLLGGAVLLAAATVVTAVLSVTGSRRASAVTRSEFLLDTVCTVTLYDRQADGEAILDEVFALCRRYEQTWSATVSGSDVDRINRSGGRPVSVSPETERLLADALSFCSLSGGRFDITIYPVKRLWHFDGESGSLPDPDALADALARVNYRQVRLDGETVTLPEGAAIDLGAMAKGCIADRMADCLRQRGVRSAVIDLGGNLYVIGGKPDGRPWQIGIKEPFGTGQAATLTVTDASVVTSGTYQRYMTVDGKRYHHLLDPATGYPCDTGLDSVSVTGACSEVCDALSTVCMLVGWRDSQGILKDYPDYRAVFVTSDGRVLSGE